MSEYVDLERWPRRATFEHFRRFDRPWFTVCTRLDAGALIAARKAFAPGELTLAYHHAALGAANDAEPLRLRIEGERVRVHERLDGSMTVLRADDTIAFAPLVWDADFDAFVNLSLPLVRAAQRGELPIDDAPEHPATVHFTTLPWLDFTSFAHARASRSDDAVPKIAFGRIVAGERTPSMAFAVEVHHALADGVHVARYVQAVQQRLDALARGRRRG